MTAIALNFISLGLGPLRNLSLGDFALIIAWTLILIVYVAGQISRFPRKTSHRQARRSNVTTYRAATRRNPA